MALNQAAPGLTPRLLRYNDGGNMVMRMIMMMIDGGSGGNIIMMMMGKNEVFSVKKGAPENW